MLGPAGIWDGEWIALAAAPVTADDVGTWPYSVGILVRWVAFLGSLHWPAAGADLGVGGVSFVEVLAHFCMSCGLVRGSLWCRQPGVVRQVGRLRDGNVGSCPASEMRGRDTVRITKVKGHADEGMAREGGVRELDRSGNDAADEAADFGRRRVDFPIIDARRNFAGVCSWWYPIILVLHRSCYCYLQGCC